MATYDKGILGPFTGTVGTVVGSTWRGKSIMRSRPKKSQRTPTPNQILQRERFTIVTKFINPLRPVLKRYFGEYMGSRSRMNLATSYFMRDVFVWNGVDYVIDFPRLMISKGDLHGLQNATIAAEPDQEIKITWVDNSIQGMAYPEDKLLVVLYDPSANNFLTFENVAKREDLQATVTADAYMSGTNVYLWATFVHESTQRAATSIYLGEITLS